MRRWLAIIVVLACHAVAAQPRDGALNEQRIEEEASRCMSDPQCRQQVAKTKAADARRQAEYEAKPLGDKVLGWIAFWGGLFAVLWFIVRLLPSAKKPPPPPPPDEPAWTKEDSAKLLEHLRKRP